MKNIWIYSFLVLFSINLMGQEMVSKSKAIAKLSPTKEQSMEARLVAGLLSQYHYEKTPIDDSLSRVIYKSFIETLDANKNYFLEEDINYLGRFEDRLDDHIKLGYLLSAYEIFNTFRDRFLARMDYIKKEIDYDFDYSTEEYLIVDNDSVQWAKNTEELNQRWRKLIKSQALDLKLDGKADTAIASLIAERYERLYTTISDYEGRDVFQLYMNNFAESFDPHTNYFSPITSDNFQIRMSQSLEGIGATLTSQNDYTKVSSVVPGGPAFESKLINTDDRILAVAQGVSGEFVNVVGWRLDDVVQLIRGPKGTIVRLSIIKAGKAVSSSIPEEITIVRDKIKLDNQVPVGEVREVYREGIKYAIGVITIPSFYLEFEARQNGEAYGSTTGDVSKILIDFKAQDVDGIVIDLRSNGGGSLQEAIDLSGLFIAEGPVVQIRNTDGTIEIGKDKNPEMTYNGPMTILTNRFSASASEIFSAALKDYKRGVLVGETTFGKGTVQNLISLNQFVPKVEDKLGQVKLTLAKYYRINGESTQHKGVTPDIIMPSPYEAEDFGESGYPRALKWDEISGTAYEPTTFVTEAVLASLNQKHQERLNNTAYLKNLSRDVEESLKNQQLKVISLNYEQRKQENKEALRKRNESTAMNESLKEKGNDESKVNTDADISDPYLRESIVVLADLIALGIG
ncbi:MAG: carboxyl-terminal processing protease [Marivirga sp.]|jgi:carboxyl-terminal processing protease